MTPPKTNYRPALVCGLLTALCLVPFAKKAFHIDDPLFLWVARQIQAHPMNPFGFEVNWYWSGMPMSEATQNPPLASYYIALIASCFGWGEVALHLGFMIPAVATILGTHLLAQRLCRSPTLATLLVLLSPAFLVSSTNLMSDTMMLAFWVWAILLWEKGLEQKPIFLAISGCLIACAILTKYFAVSLIPLLLVTSAIRQRRLGRWALAMMIPLIVLGVYEYATSSLYQRGHFLGSVVYARNYRDREGASLLSKTLIGLAFCGGGSAAVAACAVSLWRRGMLFVGFLVGLVAGLGVFLYPELVGYQASLGSENRAIAAIQR